MKKESDLITIYIILLILWMCGVIIGVVSLIKGLNQIGMNKVIINKNDYVEDIPNYETIEEPIIITNYQTRLTSFYANDGYGTGSCTGSGLCESDFQVNENGWYTYQGKLVLATATPYLLNYGYNLSNNVETYRYYDELQIVIDGINYDAIVLDSCGACMVDNRIDLFVSNRESVKDTIVEVVK